MQREILDVADFRFEKPADDGTIEGVAVTFGVIDSYRTTFDRGAFSGLSGRKIPMLWSHRQDQVIGSWSSFRVGDDGLRVKGRLNLEVERAREVRAMLVQGDVEGISIGFDPVSHEARAGGVRHITKAILREVSLVAIAAVPGARVTSIRTDRSGAAVQLVEAIRSAARAIQEVKK